MFEEIPSPEPRRTPNQRATIASFGIFLVIFVVCSAVAWFRWSGPLSLSRKISLAELVVGIVFSGVFLLTAKSTSPERNQGRMTALVLTVVVLGLISAILR
jgi:1,4-dihydroxy-2-naphthoate octaprenyltransferase